MKYNGMWRTVAVALCASAALACAACSGSPTQVNPASPALSPALTHSGVGTDAGVGIGKPDDGSQCNNGPLQVSPCYVFVGRGYGRYAQITVHYPGGDQLREHNNCRRGRFHFHFGRDIARVHGYGQTWTVVSGDQRGWCRAIFTDLSKNVSIGVQIHNSRGRRG